MPGQKHDQQALRRLPPSRRRSIWQDRPAGSDAEPGKTSGGDTDAMPAEDKDTRRQPDTRYWDELKSLIIGNFDMKIELLKESVATFGKRLAERMDASAAANEKAMATLEMHLSEKMDANAAANEKAWANLNETYKNDLRSSRWITGLVVGLVTLVTSALGAALSRYFLR
jgi:hypothetical protein